MRLDTRFVPRPTRLAAALSAAALAVLLGACSSTPVATPAAAPAPAPAQPAAAAAAPAAPALAARVPQSPAARPAHLDPASDLNRRHSIYFEYDDALLPSGARPIVESHGRYLSEHADVRMVVQGNTDERGSSEYNLALGQRRAQAVKSALALYGVRDAQVEAVSFGEEKPAASGQDEEAWRQNRRADLVYPR